ncbi:DUF1620-domain-containing protein [Ophiocordyceps camponoti-floridani]|uniref:ER membrane protein complex subunit 1 n=1 Tax=Ophiocordyceps camponoti-floridani TaxID=2030778 RepID=A0A8H4VD25_9HYPO|nr:DUF1620-domain-containing protein [Ophiocordyceps camponoti-floridani]
MRCSSLPALVLGLAALAAAVYRDEVDDVDFHYALVGLPLPDTTFFHRPRRDDKASLLYTLSDVGVLAAVNPTNGDVVWRHRLVENKKEDDDSTAGFFLRAPEGDDWLVTAHGSGLVQAWSALTGRNVWRAQFSGRIKDLEVLDLTAESSRDVLALFDEDGETVLRRLHGSRGSVVWEFRESSKNVPLQVSNDISNVYLISLSGSGSSLSLKVTSLDTATGARGEHWIVGAKGDVSAAGDVMFVGANSAAPVAAWVDRTKAKLSVNVIGTKAKHEFPLPPDVVSVRVHAPHLAQSQPHFLVHTQTGEEDGARTNKAYVFHTDLKTGHVTLAHELASFRGEGSYSTSCEGANVYFAQVSAEETLVFSSESHGVLARLPHKAGVDVGPVRAVTEVVRKAGSGEFAVRSAIVTGQDDWTLLRNGDRDWTRHEGMSDVVGAVWAEIPEREDLARVLAEEAHTNPLSAYIHRVKRHVDDLKHLLPGYLAGLPQRVLKNVAGGGAAEDKKQQGLWRDGFGFNKILVVATRRGRLYGLDSGNHGHVVWTRDTLALGGERPLVVRGLVADDEAGTVAMYASNGFYTELDASTGDVVEVSGGDSKKPVARTATVLGKLLPIGPDGMPTRELPANWDAEQTVVTVTEDPSPMLQGVKFGGRGKQVMWQFRLRPGLKLATVTTAPADEKVASIGRVLGDRRVLYKYLNANGVLVAASDEAARTLSVQVLDGVSGQVLSAQVHRGVDASLPVSCAMAENWYACAFFGDYALDDKTGRAIKGHQLVVTDLYESSEPDSRASPPLLDPRRPSGRDPTAAEMEAEGLPRYGPSLDLDDARRGPLSLTVSHERLVLAGGGFVVAPAAVESTCLMAAFGVDVYVSRLAPSGEFDVLGRGFGKIALVGTVVALLGGVLALGPMVRRKQINLRWEANL